MLRLSMITLGGADGCMLSQYFVWNICPMDAAQILKKKTLKQSCVMEPHTNLCWPLAYIVMWFHHTILIYAPCFIVFIASEHHPHGACFCALYSHNQHPYTTFFLKKLLPLFQSFFLKYTATPQLKHSVSKLICFE